MAGKRSKLDSYAVEAFSDKSEVTAVEPIPTDMRGKSPGSIKGLEKGRVTRQEKAKQPKRMVMIDVGNYEDYLYRIAKYNSMPVTKYIISLIAYDQDRNADLYTSLKGLPKYDKPMRISPNPKAKK